MLSDEFAEATHERLKPFIAESGNELVPDAALAVERGAFDASRCSP